MALVHRAKPLGKKIEPTTYTKPSGSYLASIWDTRDVNAITVTVETLAQYRTLYVCGGDNVDFDSAATNTINGDVLLHITTAGTYKINVSEHNYISLEFWQTEQEINGRYLAYGTVIVEGAQLVKVK